MTEAGSNRNGLIPGGRLLLASHNAGKLAEISAVLAPLGLEIDGAAAHGLTAPDETETTFAGNAALKARAAAEATGLPALADDSGLEVAALDGRPGVVTADWAETGAGRDHAFAVARIVRELAEVDADEPWTARFRSVLCLAQPDGAVAFFEGEVSGRVVAEARGIGGFGYDPYFIPDGDTRTFAEMAPEEKAALSHRHRALAAFLAALGNG